jgi:hypothetical protein
MTDGALSPELTFDIIARSDFSSPDERVAIVPTGPPGPQGPIGPEGPVGRGLEIDGSVLTYADLPATADLGDTYVVATDGMLYIYTEDGWPADGDGFPFRGPKGDTGDTGATGPQGEQGHGLDLSGSVPTYADLPATPALGASYIVEADGLLYIYTSSGWPANGDGYAFRGPEGPAGADGAPGDQGPQGEPGTTSWTGITDKPNIVVGSNNGTPTDLTLWVGTAAQYAALSSKDSSTVYAVTA